MHDFFSSISHHGYLFLAIVCFAEAIGLPLPAALAILTAAPSRPMETCISTSSSESV